MPRKPENQPMSYESAGVDYDAMDPYKIMAQQLGKTTSFNLERFGAKEVSESRGESAFVWDMGAFHLAQVVEDLGTKSLVADKVRRISDLMYQRTGRTYYDSIAQDTVAMIVNDISVVGASPLVVNAYFGLGSSDFLKDEERMRDIIQGWASACNLARATYGGGETPILSDIINPNSIVLAGSAVGIIQPKENLTLGDKLKVGDSILLIESSGIGSNGLSLVRKAAENPEDYLVTLSDGILYGEALLTPTHVYSRFVDGLFESNIDVHYMANITGHGWRKLMRAQRELTYIMHDVPRPQPLFEHIQEITKNPDFQMYKTFNMGAGLAVFMPEEYVEQAQEIAAQNGFTSLNAGRVEEGPRRVVIEPKGIVFEGDTLRIR